MSSLIFASLKIQKKKKTTFLKITLRIADISDLKIELSRHHFTIWTTDEVALQ